MCSLPKKIQISATGLEEGALQLCHAEGSPDSKPSAKITWCAGTSGEAVEHMARGVLMR